MDKGLALFGGSPLVQRHEELRTEWPIVSDADFQAVQRVFENRDFSGRGSPEVRKLEEEVGSYFGNRHATALSSGTAALHAALVAVGAKAGDEVIVPAFGYIAPAVSVVHNHCIPIFADIDPKTYNVSVDDIVRRITSKTTAIVVVHLHGFPAPIWEIEEICRDRNIKLIEDVAQAPGAKVNGRLVGTFGEASTLSLMSHKNIATCGEGGMLLTRSLRERNCAAAVRIYGELQHPSDTQRVYSSFTFGYNYTMNPIQAAMAREQLKKLDTLTNRLQASGRRLSRELERFDWLSPPIERVHEEAVFHFFRVRLKPESFSYPREGNFRKAVEDALRAEGLNVRLYQNAPLPAHPIFATKNDAHGGVPWSCYKSSVSYDYRDYTNTLDVIRNTVVIGAIGTAPAYLLCEGTIDLYVEGFRKIDAGIERVMDYADNLEYREPWEDVAMISDSMGARFEMKVK